MLSTANYSTSRFRNNQGQNIFYRNWKSYGNPTAIMLIIHGLNSHSGYYQNFALQLNDNNIEVYAMDIRGRGQSDGERFYISNFNDVVADIDQMFDVIKSNHPISPLFLFGHSAGGVYASVYAVRNQDTLKGLISESFAFKIPAPKFALASMKVLANFIPHVRLIKLKNEDFSRNPSVVENMNKDPLLANEKQPAKSTEQLILAGEYLKSEMAVMTLPLLILHGTADKVTIPEGSRYFMEHASSIDKQLKLYEGHYHDLLNDEQNETVIKDIIIWLNERV